MRVLLSIRPAHVDKILSGIKVFEFRRRIFSRNDVDLAVIYCTQPVGMIVGEFDIAELIKAKPIDLWSITKHGSGITRRYFDAYFLGSSVGYALRIGRCDPLLVTFIPTMSLVTSLPPSRIGIYTMTFAKPTEV